MKKIFITALFVFQLFPFFTFSQSIDDVIASVNENDIVLSYNIKNAQAGQRFNIELWYSVNNEEYKKCQTINCSDGTNIDIPAGDNKKITWYVLKDLNSLVCAKLDFEVRVTVNLPVNSRRGR